MQKFALQNRFFPEQIDINDTFGQKICYKNPTFFWKNVRFFDETMIELFPKRRNFVRLPKQSGIRQKCVGQHAKFG